MNASTKCGFLRHPGKGLSSGTNPKTIDSNVMIGAPTLEAVLLPDTQGQHAL